MTAAARPTDAELDALLAQCEFMRDDYLSQIVPGLTLSDGTPCQHCADSKANADKWQRWIDALRALRAERDAMRGALAALIAFDDDPRVSSPAAIHRYQCPATRIGRTVSGPCDCGGDALQEGLAIAWEDARARLAAPPKEPK